MQRILQFFSQIRNIEINFYKKFIVYKIPLQSDIIKNIIDIKIVENEIVIRAKI
jgi:hypothetical protein